MASLTHWNTIEAQIALFPESDS